MKLISPLKSPLLVPMVGWMIGTFVGIYLLPFIIRDSQLYIYLLIVCLPTLIASIIMSAYQLSKPVKDRQTKLLFAISGFLSGVSSFCLYWSVEKFLSFR